MQRYPASMARKRLRSRSGRAAPGCGRAAGGAAAAVVLLTLAAG
ncbi:hypothetical protein ACFQY7_26510 [Actinomadura luteofluorescens]